MSSLINKHNLLKDLWSSLCVEALTIHEVLRLAERMGLSQLLVLFDSLYFIHMLRSISIPQVEVTNYVIDIHQLIETLTLVSFQHVLRLQSTRVHSWVHEGFSRKSLLWLNRFSSRLDFFFFLSIGFVSFVFILFVLKKKLY